MGIVKDLGIEKEEMTEEDKFQDAVSKIDTEWTKLQELLDVESYSSPSHNPNIAINKEKIEKFYKRLLKVLDKTPNSVEQYWGITSIISEYCEGITGKRDSEIEKRIIHCHNLADEYLSDVIKNSETWDERAQFLLDAEPNKENFDYLVNYAFHLDHRWPVFEEQLLTKWSKFVNASVIYRYCETKSFRWVEAEDIIFKDADYCVSYAETIIKGRWPEAEPYILKCMRAATQYAYYFKFAWPAYEKKIKKRPKRINEYAKNVIHGRLPDELHNRMLMYTMMSEKPDNAYDADREQAKDYFEFLKESEQNAILFLRSISEEERKSIISRV